MTLKKELDKLYSTVMKLMFAIISYLLAINLDNESSRVVFLLLALGLFCLSLFDISVYHFSKKKDFYSKHKIFILMVLFAIILVALFSFFYLQQGATGTFWGTLIPSVVAFMVLLITVVSKQK